MSSQNLQTHLSLVTVSVNHICKKNDKSLQNFVSGIKRDKKAIENAITYRYTNALAEGSVNKLKTLKKTMYGKASFETLRKKLLWYEKNK